MHLLFYETTQGGLLHAKEKLGRLQCMGQQGFGHDLVTEHKTLKSVLTEIKPCPLISINSETLGKLPDLFVLQFPHL